MAAPQGPWAPGKEIVPPLARIFVIMLLASWLQNGSCFSSLHSTKEGGKEHKVKCTKPVLPMFSTFNKPQRNPYSAISVLTSLSDTVSMTASAAKHCGNHVEVGALISLTKFGIYKDISQTTLNENYASYCVISPEYFLNQQYLGHYFCYINKQFLIICVHDKIPITIIIYNAENQNLDYDIYKDKNTYYKCDLKS